MSTALKFASSLYMLWHCFHLSCSSVTVAHMEHSHLKAINWGFPLAGHKLNVTPIATSIEKNHFKCMVQCGKTDDCVAINLGPLQDGEHKCELLETTRYSKSNSKFIANAGWTYSGPKV